MTGWKTTHATGCAYVAALVKVGTAFGVPAYDVEHCDRCRAAQLQREAITIRRNYR